MEIGGGLVIASYLRKMLTLACVAAVLPACLITERKNYQEAPSFRPSIRNSPAGARLPLDRIVVLPDDISGADGGVRQLSFEGIIVDEPNVNDEVWARVFVNRPAAVTHDDAYAFLKKNVQILPNLLPEPSPERSFAFIIDASALNELECNKIELVVASAFEDAFTPVELRESARVVWWAGPRGADMTACNP